MKLTVTKVFHFCYGHYLPGYSGCCANQHGHNARVEIELARVSAPCPVEVYPTMVIDFKEIKRVVGPVIDSLDHKYLNGEFPELFNSVTPPTAETIVQLLWNRINLMLAVSVPYVRLVRLRVSETDDAWAELKED